METIDKNEILKILKQHSISEDNLILWYNILDNIPQELSGKFKDFFTLYPDSIPFLIQTVGEERDALLNNDSLGLKNILAKISEHLNISLEEAIKLP